MFVLVLPTRMLIREVITARVITTHKSIRSSKLPVEKNCQWHPGGRRNRGLKMNFSYALKTQAPLP